MDTAYATYRTDSAVRQTGRENAVEDAQAGAGPPGKLVAVTATGPVYRVESEIDLVPLPVGLAFLQELALRALHPDAPVVSTRAREVAGESALAAWSAAVGVASAPLLGASPAARLAFLGEVLTYVQRQDNANGIEPVLGAAINAAWPWIEPAALERLLRIVTRRLRDSEFAREFAIPILDPNTRTCRLFAPGGLADYDPSAWLDRHYLEFYAPTGMHSKLSQLSPADRELLERLLGGAGAAGKKPGGISGLGGGGDPMDEAAGKLLGKGPLGKQGGGLGDLLGGGGGPGGLLGEDGGGMDEEMAKLLGNDPLGKQAGRFGNLPGQDGDDPMRGLFGGLLDGPGVDLGNIKGNGGPLGFGANLGPGGAAKPDKELGTAMALQGAGMVVGGALMIGLGPVGVKAAGAGMAVAGAWLFAEGMWRHSDAKANEQARADANKAATDKAAADKAAADKAAADQAAEDKAKKDKEAADKKGQPADPKKKTGEKHLYPDPDGGGGTGDPTQLPRSDGTGGGKPNTLWSDMAASPTALWDDNGGGGTPTTIWDKDGSGGGTPTTTGVSLTASVLTGRGLLAGIVQVGRATYAF